MKRSLIILCCLFGLLKLSAQAPQALLQADTGRIRIGEQVTLTLSIFYTDNGGKTNIQWPVLPDSLEDGKVLIIDRGDRDTLNMSAEDAAAKMQRQKFHITAFDSAMHEVGPFAFVVNGDSVLSNSIDFQCLTFEVDTTKAIKDINGVVELKYTFLDWLLEYKYFLLIGVGILLLLVLLISILNKRKKRILIEVIQEIDNRTPFEIALAELEAMRTEQRWNRVNAKVYYTEITDVLKKYIEKRFEILALEQTTNELLGSLRFTDCPVEERNRLSQILNTADLVKFARQQTDDQTNLLAIDQSIKFVLSTKKVETPSGNEQKLQ